MAKETQKPTDAFEYVHMRERAAEVASRIRFRLESLYEKFPSDELREAIQQMKDWQKRLGEMGDE